jgi:hypothetical protein
VVSLSNHIARATTGLRPFDRSTSSRLTAQAERGNQFDQHFQLHPVKTSRDALIKSGRVEPFDFAQESPVETQASRIKGFDKLSPNGSYLFSISLAV